MTKAELEKKHLSDLHLLAAEAGVEKYRMLTKTELVERLAGGSGAEPSGSGRAERPAKREQRPRRRREPREQREPRDQRQPRERPEKAPEREPAPAPPARAERDPAPRSEPATGEQRPRRRRRRRFGRRGKESVSLQTLLLPP